jgi:hypothetical protein
MLACISCNGPVAERPPAARASGGLVGATSQPRAGQITASGTRRRSTLRPDWRRARAWVMPGGTKATSLVSPGPYCSRTAISVSVTSPDSRSLTLGVAVAGRQVRRSHRPSCGRPRCRMPVRQSLDRHSLCGWRQTRDDTVLCLAMQTRESPTSTSGIKRHRYRLDFESGRWLRSCFPSRRFPLPS